MRPHRPLGLTALAALVFFAAPVQAQNLTVSEDFTGSAASQNWTVFDGACLTAGDGSGSIPACAGLPYYSGVVQRGGVADRVPDPAGSGALRFTNSSNYQTGAILSNFSFPSGSGIAITFSTVTYGGSGADGIGFFLIDGSVNPTSVGGSGGSLGYSCSNTNAKYDGLAGAYMGLGMDEFGNFLNESDNTATGSGFRADRIGLRGAGDISWATLVAKYPTYYATMNNSTANRMAAVKKTCSTGYLWDYSASRSFPTIRAKIPYAYNMIVGSTLASGTSIDSRVAKRTDAAPITYQLKITRDNYLSLSYSYNGGTYQQVLKDQSIADANGPIPETLKFGFSGSTGGSTNIHEVMCFRAAPATLSGSSAGTNVQQGSEVRTGTQVYLAGYNPNNWSGQFTSQNLLVDTSTSLISIAANANWDASCVLTGGNCTTMGGTASRPVNIAAQGPAARTMLTWGANGGGIPFQYDSLNTAQKNTINAGDVVFNANRVNYLRGDRTNEGAAPGKFRSRDSVLGDIIDSGPAVVGVPAAGYGSTWTDNTRSAAVHPENASGAQKYAAYVTANKSRLNVVYTGANDGFVHGFRSGAYDATGNYQSSAGTPNDGREVLAYMPSTVFATIHSPVSALDYSDRLYSHAYDVNAVPYAGDLFYGNAWHTWLVGGLGAGGAGVYALDVTTPSQFSEANATAIVKADWNTANLNCFIGQAAQACGSYLGNTYGQPQIRRFHNGSWGYVFGNGRDSANGKAGIFVVLVSPVDGSQVVYFINTNNGTTAARNGLTYVTPADLDGDHVVDYVYAGDVNGNVWRFDLTDALPANWTTSQFGTGSPKPLFTTGGSQPITTRPVVSIVPASAGNPRVMVTVGTGYKSVQTATAGTTFKSGSHAFYGIWDWDMAGWNARTVSTGLRASLAGSRTIGTTDLKAQTLDNLSPTQRGLTSFSVCWQGSNDCAGAANNQYGWTIALPAGGEQVIYNPVLYDGMLLLTSTIPAAPSVLTCNDNTADSGYLMVVSPASGGAYRQSSLADTNGAFSSVIVGGVSRPVVGKLIAGVGSPTVVTYNGAASAVFGGPNAGTERINRQGANNGSRVTWQQIR